MARLPLFVFTLVCHVAKPAFGEYLQVILGEPAVFPENCSTGAELHRDEAPTGLVAVREEDVWRPSESYRDQIQRGSSLAFHRPRYADSAFYVLKKCGQSEKLIQLEVVWGSEKTVTEGEPAKLNCYYTDKHTEFTIKWWKAQEMVLELNMPSQKIKNGTAFNRRMSLSPEGYKEGEWSLSFEKVLQEDGGDYFCSVHHKHGARKWGAPAAVRLNVTRRDQSSTSSPTVGPSQRVTEETAMGAGTIVCITAAVVIVVIVVIVALVSFLLCWFLKKPCSRVFRVRRDSDANGNTDSEWTSSAAL
ncbi:hypothetical protein F7725_004869 [Dissostichus mawsoni]|uniref:Ig-like domain-containing protein n=1 Tax=Dissostichus mawsoni TaxID=36200 RepID=A0A7J5XK02_DISMA|nr:hypothetical protein F7725_004869 [Dissostichus mawsoni]